MESFLSGREEWMGRSAQVWSARRSLSSPPIQNRACNFRFTRLLSVWSVVSDTSRLVGGDACHILDGFFVVAVSMVDPLIAESIRSTQGGRDAMIDFE